MSQRSRAVGVLVAVLLVVAGFALGALTRAPEYVPVTVPVPGPTEFVTETIEIPGPVVTETETERIAAGSDTNCVVYMWDGSLPEYPFADNDCDGVPGIGGVLSAESDGDSDDFDPAVQ